MTRTLILSLTSACALAISGAAEAQTLFADLNAASPTEEISSNPRSIRGVGGQAFFTADSPVGAEPYVTDGTAQGTMLLKDVNPGVIGSEASGFTELGNGIHVFAATTTQSGRELWRTDGTESGTAQLKDIRVGGIGSDPDTFRALGGLVYFFANNGPNGRELWRTDGTTNGTFRVKDAIPGIAGIGMNQEDLCVSGGFLYFPTNVAGTGQFLWKSDGTGPGTIPLALITANTSVEIAELTDLNGLLIFTAQVPTLGQELWQSDGTASGTRLLVNIQPSGSSKPRNLTRVGSFILFTADHPSVGAELFRTDGTAHGTTIVADIQPGGGIFGGSEPEPVGVLNQLYIFSAWNQDIGRELYVSDGSVAGTSLLRDLWHGPLSSAPIGGVQAGDDLFFSATHGVLGVELWATDGTAAGTRNVADLTPGFDDHKVSEITALGAGVVFSADSGAVGRELYTSDGTSTGTQLVADIAVSPVSVSSNPEQLTRVGDRLFFTAESEAEGRELYVSDGTVQGTGIVLPFHPGAESTFFGGLTPLGDKLFFVANDPIHGAEPRITDGTPEGTKLLVDSFPGPADSIWGAPSRAVLGDILVFAAFDLQFGPALMRTDGTPEGTVQFESINAAVMQTVGDQILFVGSTPATGQELYRTDGTPAGTHLVVDTIPGPQSGVFAQELVVVGDRVFFPASHPTLGFELWVSDGTAAGTHVVSDLTPGSVGTSYSNIVGLDDFVLLHTVEVGSSGAHHRLFRSDGTAAGTTLVHDLGAASAIEFRSNGSEAYFYSTSVIPWKLWRTDGTPSGTGPVAGADPAFPASSALIGSGGTLAMVLNEPGVGDELFATAGGFNAPVLVADVAVGGADSSPDFVTRLGSQVFFSADDGLHGRELHVVPLSALSEYVTESIGHGCSPIGHPVPTLVAESAATAPGNLALRLAGLAAQAPAVLAIGAGEVHQPFSIGCTLYVKPPWFTAVLTADGSGEVGVSVPLTPSLVGIRAVMQGFAAAGVSTAATPGLEIVIGS